MKDPRADRAGRLNEQQSAPCIVINFFLTVVYYNVSYKHGSNTDDNIRVTLVLRPPDVRRE